MRLSFLASVFLVLALPLAAAAQSREATLADIRQELSLLHVEIEQLRRELSTTGLPGGGMAGGSALERLDTIQLEVQRLTAKTEELEHRITRVASDGANRIGDLEFRLVELEGGDISKLGQVSTLGGEVSGGGAPAAAPAPARNSGAQMAIGEQMDFDRAKEALDSGSFRTAADLFQTFAQTYTGGPLTGEAHFWRGEAHSALGETAQAARAYLESFSGFPDGSRAPDALYKLGTTLSLLGQVQEACVTLDQVGMRYPATAAAADAAQARRTLPCP